jgi:hypothetical protein
MGHHHHNPTYRIPPISYYALNSSHRPKSYDRTNNDNDSLSKYFMVSDVFSQKEEPISDRPSFSIVSAFNTFFNENVYWYL